MGLPAINSLQNMEFLLYGGASGYNSSCPSYANGYKGGVQNSVFNPYGVNFGYPNYNPYNMTFGGYNQQPQLTNDVFQSQAQTAQNPTAFGASQEDLDILTKYYMTDMAPSESLKGAAVGGAMFGLMNNARFILHPWNAVTSIGKTDKLFKSDAVKEIFKKYMAGEEVGKIGETVIKGNAAREVMFDAYGQLHRLECLNSGWRAMPLFKKSLKSLSGGEGTYKTGEELYNALKSEMERALASGNAEKITKATEKIKVVTGAKTGLIPRGWNKFKSLFTGNYVEPMEKINTKLADEAIAGATEKALAEKATLGTFKGSLKHSCKLGSGLLFAAFEFLSDFMSGDIQAAFSKDTTTGMKQLGQTAIKGAGSAIGWSVGEGIGMWAGAKLGAMAGTAIAPGVGTAIGAVAGLIGGSIGCWAMGKLTHWLVGDNVGAKVQAEQLGKTQEGQKQLLQLTYQKAEQDLKDGKQVDPRTLQAINNVANVYA